MDKKQIAQAARLEQKKAMQEEKQRKKIEEKTRKKQEAEAKKAANKTRKMQEAMMKKQEAEAKKAAEKMRKMQEAMMKKQEAEKKKADIKAQKEAAKTLKKQAAHNNKVATQTRKRKIKIIEGSPINIPFSVLPSNPSPIRKEPLSVPVSGPKSSRRLNEPLASIMAQLSTLMAKNGDNMRARVYARAEETILSVTEDITDINMLQGKPGIGPTIMEKMKEFVETGTLQLIEREKNKPENILSDVYGIGPQKAKDLVSKGIDSIAKLREKQDEVLNKVQKIGLKHYDDILLKIPRQEIDAYHHVFEESFDATHGKFEIVGSYRRGAPASGDIDVIVTSDRSQTFDDFLNVLLQKKVITDVLSRGKSKSLVVAKIPSSAHYRRVDFLYTSPEEFPFALLYFTGSKAFNTVMRGHAVKMGYSLNEHGMTKEGKKVDHAFTSEGDIFDFLKLQYKDPRERLDGRMVISAVPLDTRELPPPVKKVRKSQKKSPVEKKIPKKDIKIMEEISKEEAFSMNKNASAPKIADDSSESKALIEDFKRNGISVLDRLNEKTLSQIVDVANAQYYNETPLMNDNEFDIIKEYIERKYPKNTAIANIGAPITKNKVKLPYEMASMDKIKPDTGALMQWKQKYGGPYVLSCKLDGVSGLYVVAEKGGEAKLYTRGDGKVGQDVSHLISAIHLPTSGNAGQTYPLAVRGEFILPKKVFDEKYKEAFANPRNLVSGIVNSKTIDDKTRDLHFVAYEVVDPPMKPSTQMAQLATLGHEVVMNRTVTGPTDLTNEMLSELLLDWRKNYEYEIDGVIVTNDQVYPRKSGNPDHAFAFKMVISDQMAEAKVVDVIWTPSKNGMLKPRVRIEPVKLGGVTIEYATGFNGKFIEDNKIGIGALIQIVRSGDVIPYIKNVSVPAETTKMPDMAYVWNDTHVDILLENSGDNETVLEKNITGFFVHLEVDGLSIGNVRRIMKAGYTSVAQILKMSKEDFAKVEGFQTKTVDKIYAGIHAKVDAASLLDIMVASNKMGKGMAKKKLQPILETFPDILTTTESPAQKIEMLKSIKGIGSENAKEFVQNIGPFMAFLKECDLESKLQRNAVVDTKEAAIVDTKVDVTHPLYQKKIVMTKIRDKEIIEALAKYGATLEDTMKKDVFVLVVKSKDDTSSKMDFAKKNNIPIMTPEEFKATYMK
jgi:NAD-dependent DNA ligase